MSLPSICIEPSTVWNAKGLLCTLQSFLSSFGKSTCCSSGGVESQVLGHQEHLNHRKLYKPAYGCRICLKYHLGVSDNQGHLILGSL